MRDPFQAGLQTTAGTLYSLCGALDHLWCGGDVEQWRRRVQSEYAKRVQSSSEGGRVRLLTASTSSAVVLQMPTPCRRRRLQFDGPKDVLSDAGSAASSSHPPSVTESERGPLSEPAASRCWESLERATSGNDTRHRNVVQRMCSLSLSRMDDSESQGSDASQFGHMHPSFMVAMLKRYENQADQFRQLVKQLKKDNKQLENKVAKLQNELDEKNQKRGLEVTRINDNVKLTPRGLCALGVRKALSLTSAVSFPMASLVDTSRWTVIRAEVAVWSMLVCRARVFNQLCWQLLDGMCGNSLCDANTSPTILALVPLPDSSAAGPLPLGPLAVIASMNEMVIKDLKINIPSDAALMTLRGPEEANGRCRFTLAVTEFSGDATNSNIWQNSKLSGLMVTLLFLTDVSKFKSGRQAVTSAFAVHRTMPLVMLEPPLFSLAVDG